MTDEVTVGADAAYLRSVAEYIERDGSDEGVADAHNLRSIADRITRTTTAVPNSVVEALDAALGRMLTFYGMDYDPSHDTQRVVHAAAEKAREQYRSTLQQSAPAAAKQDSDAELLREASKRLKAEAVHMEYDYPGDAEEECGLWCRICADHVEDDHSNHAPTCLIARIDTRLSGDPA